MTEIPEVGSVAVGRRVHLPGGAGPPIKIYINGIVQSEGDDYVARGGEILFMRPIVKEEVSKGRWLAMGLGLFGSYKKNEVVDVEYRVGGEVKLASNVEILP